MKLPILHHYQETEDQVLDFHKKRWPVVMETLFLQYTSDVSKADDQFFYVLADELFLQLRYC